MRLGMLLGCLLMSGSLVRLEAQSAQDIESALRAGDGAAAVRMSRKAVQADPKNVRLRVLEGLALATTGNTDGALAAYEAALKVDAHYLPALLGAANLEYKTQNPKAVARLKTILQLRPDDPTVHAMLGAIAFRNKDCTAVLEHFSHSQALVSQNPEALEQQAACHAQKEKYDEASADLQRVLTLQPERRATRYNLASLQLRRNQPAIAIETLNPLVNGTTVDADALDLAAMAQEAAGDTPKAVELLRKAIEANPDREEYYLDFATISFNHSSFDAGVSMLSAGLERLPRSARLFAARGILYAQQSSFDKSEADFAKAEELDPKQSFVSQAEALAKIQGSDVASGAVTLRAKIKSHPQDAYLHALLAQTLLTNGAAPGAVDFDEARKAAQQAVRLDPKLLFAHDVLSDIYLKDAKHEAAIEECRAALQIDANDQVAIYRLVQALRRTNQPEEIPVLLKRLSALREADRKKEAEAHRYKLVEDSSPVPATSQ